METPGASERARWARRLGDGDVHARLLAELPVLREVDRGGDGAPVELTGWVRVAAWNVQRGRRPAEVGAAPGRVGGRRLPALRARSGHGAHGERGRRRPPSPRTWAPATRSAWSSSSWASVTPPSNGRRPAGATCPACTATPSSPGRRWETRGSSACPRPGPEWFAADSPQPRVGGRMAVVATVTIDGVAVEVASAHLENRSDPAHRAEQMEALLQVVDERSEGGPAVVGGDLNTLGASYAELFDHHRVRALRRVEPARFSWPVALRTALRRGAGARFRVDRRQRRRAHHRARRARAPRPRADQVGLAPRSRPGGAPRRRGPGRWPVGPPPRLGRRATAMTVAIRPAHQSDAAAILVRRRRRLRRRHARRATRSSTSCGAPGPACPPPSLIELVADDAGDGRRVICRPHPATSTAAPRPSPGWRPCAWRRRTSSVARALR